MRQLTPWLSQVNSGLPLNQPTRLERVVGESTGMDALTRLDVEPTAIEAFCRRHGISRLAVFGSALRDDFTAESDVDLLVEFRPAQKVSLFDMARMEMELEKIVHDHRVDLRTAGDLSHRFRDRVGGEAELVFDAAGRRRPNRPHGRGSGFEL